VWRKEGRPENPGVGERGGKVLREERTFTPSGGLQYKGETKKGQSPRVPAQSATNEVRDFKESGRLRSKKKTQRGDQGSGKNKRKLAISSRN